MGVNEKQKTLVPKIKDYFKGFKRYKFALWGLAFKPDTDDIESPALYIIEELLARCKNNCL